ncbi:MAG: hypothetical protein AAF844_09140 [Pseudomonadota bacterium]
MRWSKLKKRIEDGFADAAKGRVEVWVTRYRDAHDEEGEAWITIDKKRVHSMGSFAYLNALAARKVRLHNDCVEAGGNPRPYGFHEEAELQLSQEGIVDHYGFQAALFDYLNRSIDDVLQSPVAVVRALGMVDRRLGKRRLRTLDLGHEHPLVCRLHHARCTFEGVARAGAVVAPVSARS